MLKTKSNRKSLYIESSCFEPLIEHPSFSKIASLFVLKSFDAHEVIYLEHETSTDTIYLLGKGLVKVSYEITTLLEEDDDTLVGQAANLEISKVPGEFFGNEAVVMKKNNPSRAGTAVSITDSECALISFSKLKAFCEKNSEKFNDIYDLIILMLGSRLVKILCKTGIYDKDVLNAHPLLWQMWSTEALYEDDVLFEEGSVGSDMHIVYNGILKLVFNEDVEHKSKNIETFIEEGNLFGEIGVLVDAPRAGTVYATCNTLVLSMKWTNFNRLLTYFPTIARKVTTLARTRVVYNFRKYSIPFFESLSSDQYAILGQLCSIMQVPPGESIFDIGEIGDRFFMISSGEIGIYVPNDEAQEMKFSIEDMEMHEVCRIDAGRYFGEMALLTDSVRCASAKAISRCVVLSISRSKFEKFFELYPQVAIDFQIKLAKYKISLEQVLSHPTATDFFQRHCKHFMTDESLDFFIQVREFNAQKEGMTPKEVKEQVDKILVTFINDNCDRPINISFKTRNKIIEASAQEEYPLDILEGASDAIFELMKRDVFPRFKTSPFFQDFLKEIEVYDYVPDEK